MKVIIKFITTNAIDVYHKGIKAGSNIGADKLLFKTMFKEKTLSEEPFIISIKARQPKLLKHILQQNGFNSLVDMINKFLEGESLKQNIDYNLELEK